MVTRPMLWFATALALCSCGVQSFEDLADIGVCNPVGGSFTVDVDHPYFPLPVGQQVVLEGSEGGRPLLVRVTALDETETVSGVETRVGEEYEEEGGRLVEISRDFFAQTQDGTVCYFGEDVDTYDAAGNVTSHSGAWRADGQTNLPGVFMPSSLEVGVGFQQEMAPGIAEDQAKVVALGQSTAVPAGTYTDTVTLLEINPLERGGGDTKVCARGIGVIIDGPAELTSYSVPAE